MKVFAGSCVIESKDMCEEIVEKLLFDFKNIEVDYCFKASFDKANRTSALSYRGPGINKGLKILQSLKEKYSVPVLTDIHLPEQAEEVASVVDVVQIPAFLSRQTDILVESAKACRKYNRTLKIKKGQFLSPYDMKNVVEKVKSFIGVDKILLTERGTCFGYNNLIVDMSSFHIMKSFGVETIHDATHCVQKPGGLGNKSGGAKENIEFLAKAAIAAGADGIFLECHPNPEKALSDSSTSIQIDKVKPLIEKLIRIKNA